MTKEIEDCIGFEDDLNNGFTIEKQVPSELVQWTMNYLPISLIQAVSLMYTIATVSVLANVTEEKKNWWGAAYAGIIMDSPWA